MSLSKFLDCIISTQLTWYGNQKWVLSSFIKCKLIWYWVYHFIYQLQCFVWNESIRICVSDMWVLKNFWWLIYLWLVWYRTSLFLMIDGLDGDREKMMCYIFMIEIKWPMFIFSGRIVFQSLLNRFFWEKWNFCTAFLLFL